MTAGCDAADRRFLARGLESVGGECEAGYSWVVPMTRRLTSLALLIALTAGSISGIGTKPEPPETEAEATTRIYRKMHIVRPDLLPYPVAFAYYC